MYLEILVKTDTLGNFIIENGASGELNNNNLRKYGGISHQAFDSSGVRG